MKYPKSDEWRLLDDAESVIKNVEKLIRPANPGILPRGRDVVVISAVPNIGAIAVAEFYGLVSIQRDRRGNSDA